MPESFRPSSPIDQEDTSSPEESSEQTAGKAAIRPTKEALADRVAQIAQIKAMSPMGFQETLMQFEQMSEGDDADGVRDEFYAGWTNEDFAEVLNALNGSGESRTETAEEAVENLDDTMSKLSPDVRALLPESNLDYYRKTSGMHCDTSVPGGSKFLEVPNILKVLEKDGSRIAEMIKNREDDRQAFLDAGVDQQTFLPSTKNPGDPEGLPEALYYKVEGFKGKLGVVQLEDIDSETTIIVRREKSSKDEQGNEKVPCSFSVIKETLEEMPDTDFATVIIGREGGEQGKDELWTIHPGAPVRAVQGDFIQGSENLSGPQEGVKQKIMVVKIKDLLTSGKISLRDYVKIMPGKQEEILAQYETV